MRQYDIFISYRRTSYDTANLIATRLKAAGYSVFFDMETMRSGKFNEQLYNVIENCKDFVVVLPPGALDRCVNEDDWVRLEIIHAMKHNKNIIPVMLNGFEWMKPMPAGMEELPNYQALTASSIEYFDLSMERLMRQYLTSKRHIAMRKVMAWCGIGLASLMVLLLILWGVFKMLSRDVCEKYVTQITNCAGSVHSIAEENEKLKRDWNDFVNEINRGVKGERLQGLQESMLAEIDVVEKNIKYSWKVDSAAMSISDYHSFLLSLNGINAEEIAIAPVYSYLYYSDYLNQLDNVRNAVIDPTTYNVKLVSTLFEVFKHEINTYYVAILEELSAFPKNSRKSFEQVSSLWIYFPKEYAIDLDKEYYESITNAETQKAEALLSRFKSVLEVEDAWLNDMDRKLEDIESVKDSIDAYSDEIAQLNVEQEKTFNTMKSSCKVSKSSEQWTNWGYIRRWGLYLSMLAEDSQEVSFTVTPQRVYAEISDNLNEFKTLYPDSREYVESARLFFKKVSESKLDYNGVLIYAFAPGTEHPYLKVGDIIVGYGGKTVKDRNALSAYFKQDSNGALKILRYNKSGFSEMTFQKLEQSDIVGFLDITEEITG